MYHNALYSFAKKRTAENIMNTMCIFSPKQSSYVCKKINARHKEVKSLVRFFSSTGN